MSALQLFTGCFLFLCLFGWALMHLFDPRSNVRQRTAADAKAMMALVQAPMLARFHKWEFSQETKSLEVETASVEQLERALDDCLRCTAVEYPETEDGTEYSLRRADELIAAIQSRFPAHLAEIKRRVSASANRCGGAAHGYNAYA